MNRFVTYFAARTYFTNTTMLFRNNPLAQTAPWSENQPFWDFFSGLALILFICLLNLFLFQEACGRLSAVAFKRQIRTVKDELRAEITTEIMQEMERQKGKMKQHLNDGLKKEVRRALETDMYLHFIGEVKEELKSEALTKLTEKVKVASGAPAANVEDITRIVKEQIEGNLARHVRSTINHELLRYQDDDSPFRHLYEHAAEMIEESIQYETWSIYSLIDSHHRQQENTMVFLAGAVVDLAIMVDL